MTLCALLGGQACTLMDFFFNHSEAGLLYLFFFFFFFYSEVLYDSFALWFTADRKALSPQVCITRQTGQRSGLAT